MAKKFKYNLDALEWDDKHRRNKEGVYCYCGMDYNDGDSMLQCGSCAQLFHWDCVACLKTKPLRGDIFYQFKCSVCNGGEGGEEYQRDALSWVQVIYLVLYHLSMADPEKKYFRWRENICATINDNWSGLYPEKAKTATWQNTVAGCLSTHNMLFKSGFEDTQQTGNWALHEIAEPTREKFKASTKSRDASSNTPKTAKRAGGSKKKKKATGAEKEILMVLDEGKSNKRAARHRVSFSDDEDEEEGERAAARRGKRRRQNMKALEDDSELMQSVELFTQLEKQRQDTGTNMEAKEDGFDVLDECSSLSSWASDEFETKVPKKTPDGEASEKTALVDDANASDPCLNSSGVSKSAQEAKSTAQIAKTAQEAKSTQGPKGGASDRPLPVSASQTLPSTENVGEPALSELPNIPGDAKSPTERAGDVERLESVGDTPSGAVEISQAPAGEISQTSVAGIAPQRMFGENAANCTRTMMSEREQWDVCERISASRVAMGMGVPRRVRRRLQLRRLKRMLGLPVFDIDRVVCALAQRPQRPWDIGEFMAARAADQDGIKASLVRANVRRSDDDGAGCYDAVLGSPAAPPDRGTLCARPGDTQAAKALETTSAFGTTSGAPNRAEMREVKTTSYMHSFASRLMGRAVLRDNLTAAGTRISPFHGRRLRPFIWRDPQTMADAPDGRPRLPMLRVLRDIRSREHRIFRMQGVDPVAQTDHETIDYVYLQSTHIQQVNALLCRTFWPGIDMSEALQYPEFSIVALYRRRVVGCAFLTPDAYLTYIAVAAGWEGAGIAKYMVFHLTQTVPTKDVTLHVAASNVAMLLYQQMGFKPETYAPGFYKAYLPETSRVCPNAFFMRLRRY
ncbi:hypothetical protein IWW50_001513 [Coemansia erecta]|nr:hypothetical protein IWW50_001513 [Coemansia erecta]